jgi:hypothetical protein
LGFGGYVTAVAVSQIQRLYSGSGVRTLTWYDIIKASSKVNFFYGWAMKAVSNPSHQNISPMT